MDDYIRARPVVHRAGNSANILGSVIVLTTERGVQPAEPFSQPSLNLYGPAPNFRRS